MSQNSCRQAQFYIINISRLPYATKPTDYLQLNHVITAVFHLTGLLTLQPNSLYYKAATLYVIQNFLTLSPLTSDLVRKLTAIPFDLKLLLLIEIPYHSSNFQIIHNRPCITFCDYRWERNH